MSKRKFSAGWYAGSVREAKRNAYLAGAEAALDVVMKVMDHHAKQALRMKPDADATQRLIFIRTSQMLINVSDALYQGIQERAMVTTPFDPPAEDLQLLEQERDPVVEREPGTAARE